MKISLKLNQVLGLPSLLLAALFLITSCTCEETPILKELKICDQRISDGDVECDENLATFSQSSAQITASSLVAAHDASSVLTVTLNVIENGVSTPALEKSINIAQIDEDVEGECKVWVATGWGLAAGQVWPAGSYEIVSSLNATGSPVLKQAFTIN